MRMLLLICVCLGILTTSRADELLFRQVEQRSKSLQLDTLAKAGGSCTPRNVAVRREW